MNRTDGRNSECTIDTDCTSGASCVDGMCILIDSCISEQCQQEEFCKKVTCIRDNNNSFIPCSQDEDCRDGYACSSLDICIDPLHPLHVCGEELSCGSKARCQNGTCFSLSKPGKIV